jgi:hypothetical protein
LANDYALYYREGSIQHSQPFNLLLPSGIQKVEFASLGWWFSWSSFDSLAIDICFQCLKPIHTFDSPTGLVTIANKVYDPEVLTDQVWTGYIVNLDPLANKNS